MSLQTHSFDFDAGSRTGSNAPGLAARIASGWRDLFSALLRWRLWTMLGWNDIRQRYRRSKIGPFWITISMAIFITLLGVIYARIFGRDVSEFMPYVAAGLITFRFVSGSTTESCNAFIGSAPIIRQINLPYSIYVIRTVWRDFLIFLHVIVLFIPIYFIFGIPPRLVIFLALPGIFLLLVNQLWVGMIISVLSTRFRDMPPLVQTAVQISMFATPIMWPISAIAGAEYIAYLNPLYHLIELVRAPLLGSAPSIVSWLVVIGMCVVGHIFAAWLLQRAKPRIVYWL